jgi:hypothetical protein
MVLFLADKGNCDSSIGMHKCVAPCWVWLLLLVYLEVWKWHNQNPTNMQYTHFPTVIFANLHSSVVLMLIYCRNKTILCFLQLTHPLTSALVAQICNEKEHSSSLLSKLNKYTGSKMSLFSNSTAVYLNGISMSRYSSLIWALCA